MIHKRQSLSFQSSSHAFNAKRHMPEYMHLTGNTFFFDMMKIVLHRISSRIEHYGVHGGSSKSRTRAGSLEDAFSGIEGMPMKPNEWEATPLFATLFKIMIWFKTKRKTIRVRAYVQINDQVRFKLKSTLRMGLFYVEDDDKQEASAGEDGAA
ncbi:pentatricopeptide repeat-containing protein [Tripterygium wilfordii]|uniref:Pentatricopeptide repeat-containing protein n=1 Tax=Tripterygium wilfordii TaxID=458696 RepID=A0A7J7DF31_TRIWF|nr:pentatricopeptide repeat-containing protein [Tripterygium wilfordii]